MSGMLDAYDQVPNREPDQDRLVTAHLRQPPAFLIIGTQKGGTTSLHHYLGLHDSVSMAMKKEVHFFDYFSSKGIDWYLAHFALWGEATLTGEASPSYLYHPETPTRVHDALPHVKLIALLRNPVDRAYSHHQMNVRKGIEPLSFEDAIDQESSRLDESHPDFASGNWRHYSYVSRGLYAEQLERWLRVFSREQLLLLKSEEFSQDPAHGYQRVLEFLELPAATLPTYRSRKSGGYSAMPSETRMRLRAYFNPYNRRLYDLIDWDLGWDRE
jgi:hypothetical protein